MLLNVLRQLLLNDILWASIVASTLAQFLKPLTYWIKAKEFNWHHIAATGGMPSSHSALVSAVATGVGLLEGFNSPLFAITVVLAMIVTYDAAGVRREAGDHARAINQIIAELLSGQPVDPPHLQEVLGHSRKEVAAGVTFGITIMLIWKLVLQPLFLV